MVNVEDILKDLGITYQESGKGLKILCFFHEEKIPSLSIDKSSGIWHCFSCGKAGNIFTLIKYLSGIEGIEALRYLKDYVKINNTTEDIYLKLKEKIIGKIPIRKIVKVPKNRKISSHPYLIQRGIYQQEIEEWDMREVLEPPYKSWILIPISQNGILRNYFLRDTIKNRKRYSNLPRKDILFGIDKAFDFNKPIYIVEGIFDLIFLRRVGVQVVASLSNRLYTEQIELLKNYKEVILVPDNDLPGLYLVNDARTLLYNTKLGVCLLPQNRKDTAECNNRELLNLINSKISFLDFICSKRYMQWKLEKSNQQTFQK